MRKRIKKYSPGGTTLPKNWTAGEGFSGTAAGQGIGMFGAAAGQFIAAEDQRDGNMSTGGALASGALKGASMGAALGPLGMLAGAGIGMVGGMMQRDTFNDEARQAEEQERKAELARERAERQAELAAMDGILEQHPVKGTTDARFAKGGNTKYLKTYGIGGDTPEVGPAPNGRRWNLRDLFLALPQSQKLLFDPEIQKAYGSMTDEEVQSLIGTAVPMIKDVRGAESLGDKIDVVRNADLSWVKPLREKAGLSKNELIDKAAEAGMLKKWAKLPVKGAAAFMDFELGGSTLPKYETGGEHDPFKTIGRAALGPVSAGWQAFKENLGKNLAPAGYETSPGKNIKRVVSAGFGYPDALTQSRQNQNSDSTFSNTLAERDDLWHMVLGLDQPNNTVKESEYRPTNENDPNSVYYSSSVTEEGLRKELDQNGLEAIDKMVKAGPGRHGGKNTLGNFTVAKGQDDKGHYISYYDIWDLNPISKGPGALRTLENAGQSLLGLETPEVYGRIYYNPETGKPIEQKALGGMTGPHYEAEGGEMIQYKNGDMPKVYGKGGLSQVSSNEAEIKGPKHSGGGVDMSDEKGARIYSDKLTVDPALLKKLSEL